ncbi:SDR family oxidoreductase [Olivibacter domesticus]|uniref:Short chain dehydrogenase n=1 Tax=Olivibacter domesticus TaxID=407022 RepID=A0A1H7UB28_OLID1|nr:hypothetical protein [Olivibacter domesticus]SEL93966.1 hypothetical protein SAMN05661044_03807 [Olivibacter domesticus]
MKKSILLINTMIDASSTRKFGKAGYRVGIIGRDLGRLERQQASLLDKGINCFFIVANPASESELRKAITAMQVMLGKVDFLIYKPVAEQKRDIIKRSISDVLASFGPVPTKVVKQKPHRRVASSRDGGLCIQPMSVICGFGIAGKGRYTTFGFLG